MQGGMIVIDSGSNVHAS